MAIGQEFMAATSLRRQTAAGTEVSPFLPPLQVLPESGGLRLPLPAPDSFPALQIDLLEFIELRTSVRQYSLEPLTREELALLLWCTQGVKMVIPDKATFRTVPSAGARHAFETYLLIQRVEGIAPGLYRYLALEHEVQLVEELADGGRKIHAACLNQACIGQSAVTFFWIAVAERMTSRYGQRGYRYLHLDAGHVCQNLYLSGEVIGCGTCAIGAYDDERLNAALGIDGVELFVVYAAALGRK